MSKNLVNVVRNGREPIASVKTTVKIIKTNKHAAKAARLHGEA